MDICDEFVVGNIMIECGIVMYVDDVLLYISWGCIVEFLLILFRF